MITLNTALKICERDQLPYNSKGLIQKIIEDVSLMVTIDDIENQRFKNGLIVKRKELVENILVAEQLSV